MEQSKIIDMLETYQMLFFLWQPRLPLLVAGGASMRASSSWCSSGGGLLLVGEGLGGGTEVDGAVKGFNPWRSPSGWLLSNPLSVSIAEDLTVVLACENCACASRGGFEPATSREIAP